MQLTPINDHTDRPTKAEGTTGGDFQARERQESVHGGVQQGLEDLLLPQRKLGSRLLYQLHTYPHCPRVPGCPEHGITRPPAGGISRTHHGLVHNLTLNPSHPSSSLAPPSLGACSAISQPHQGLLTYLLVKFPLIQQFASPV